MANISQNYQPIQIQHSKTQLVDPGISIKENVIIKTPMQMLSAIAKALDMDAQCYRMRSRERNIVELRFIAALFLRRNFPLITLQQIAAFFGGQDHSSVINGLSRSYELLYCKDDRFLKKYNVVLQTLA